MGQAGSGREFHVNSGSDRVGVISLVGRVGSRKLDKRPTLRLTQTVLRGGSGRPVENYNIRHMRETEVENCVTWTGSMNGMHISRRRGGEDTWNRHGLAEAKNNKMATKMWRNLRVFVNVVARWQHKYRQKFSGTPVAQTHDRLFLLRF